MQYLHLKETIKCFAADHNYDKNQDFGQDFSVSEPNYTVIAPENFEMVERIILHGEVDEISAEAWSPFTSVTQFSAYSLQTIKRQDFSKMTGLTDVEIVVGGKSLPSDVFNSLASLEVLELSDSNITTLPEELLFSNQNLTYFFMNYHQIETLPKNFFSSNPKLILVSMTDGPLQRINEDFTKLQRIIDLSFDRNDCLSSSTYQLDKKIAVIQDEIEKKCRPKDG